MGNLFLIIIFLAIGVLLQSLKMLPSSSAKYLNNYLIYIVLPTLSFRFIPDTVIDSTLLMPISTAWISFGLSWSLFGTLGKVYLWDRSLTGCLIITAGLANTSFVGFPIVNALYGEEALKTALIIDQAGSFIIVSSIAIIVASIYSKEKKRKRDVSKQILTFPPFISFVLAIMMNLLSLHLPAQLDFAFEMIGQTLTPVALIAVGLQLKVNFQALKSTYLWLGLGFKLVLAPMVIYILYGIILKADGLIFEVSVIETAMAPMITGSIIAISHDLKPKLASLLVGVGIPLSFLSIGIWYWIVSL
ncbi:AEC family transporter [Belliella kenyensis]|uniref:AEC family transporter n=1 Tax=Belliella kenyensis TaxID=1472724 RepID=A0ABV8EN99_9BACT|nr:AEC family transporter [Belliella kenyensis]MCH7401546.1 AEC family transporter [Belliella kenyensis]MDN3603174.1 AEC family transporter [Belliella kenyensis]